MARFKHFDPSLVRFLKQLQKNNDREWFNEHKDQYEALVREPALDFISAMGQPIADIAPYFVAIPKKVGGSLMRPYRDTRFSKDKTPLKTNVGIQFRHEFGKDVRAPGYYFHIDPDGVFIGAGIWHPAPDALKAIRARIAERGDEFVHAVGNRRFRRHFELAGDSLTRPPRGFTADHAQIESLKRKDFIAVKNLTHADLYRSGLTGRLKTAYAAATPLMQFLCAAVNVKF